MGFLNRCVDDEKSDHTVTNARIDLGFRQGTIKSISSSLSLASLYNNPRMRCDT